MTNLTKFFGNRVREIRSAANITQEELAYMANIDRGYMGHIERGTKSPTLDKVEQIAKALNLQPTNILK
ncbi:MAG: helix-turn-helix transcriptional regulator [Gammaproteobacteria bacterium]|nr:helix-turn-helix transcriptional regulator [Gammaproteobacteria bacterium]